jgi:AmmeMemoRadiSam system protein B
MIARKVRAPVVDDIFYPAEREALEEAVRGLLGRSAAAPGEAPALVLPHAAYAIVGDLLAAGFCSASRRRIERAVILAPMHRDAGNRVVLPESSAFLTPLGETAVDEETIGELEGWSTAIIRSDVPHLEEHAVEVCLPFIQVLFPGASVIPILVGRAPAGLLKTVGRALTNAFGERWDSTLLVASTNLNGDSGGLREANAFLNALGVTKGRRGVRASARAAAIVEGARRGRITACGAHAVAALLELAPASGEPRLLARGDSGDEAPRRTYYGAVALG